MHLLQLHSNPWNCDCHLKNFRDWVVYRGLYTYPTSCQEPERLAGNKILVVKFHIQELNLKLINQILLRDNIYSSTQQASPGGVHKLRLQDLSFFNYLPPSVSLHSLMV